MTYTRNTLRLLAAAVACGATFATAQEKPADYPNRPIRIIVPVVPGGGNDTVARAVGQMITERWGQSVVIDNRPGGGTVVATELAAKAPPDGYTVFSATNTVILLGAMKRVSFDIRKAFDPIAIMTSQPYILITNLSLPVKSVKELIEYSKSKEPITYGSSGVGTIVHLGMEQLAQLSGARLLHVPYKGTAQALTSVMGGEVHSVPASAISGITAMKTGKVRALAVMGLERLPALPDLPTIAEQGFPGYRLVNSYNLIAPAGTPRHIQLALNRLIVDGMRAPQMAKRLAADGSQPGEPLRPDELKAQFAREYLEVEKLVKNLNLKMY